MSTFRVLDHMLAHGTQEWRTQHICAYLTFGLKDPKWGMPYPWVSEEGRFVYVPYPFPLFDEDRDLVVDSHEYVRTGRTSGYSVNNARQIVTIDSEELPETLYAVSTFTVKGDEEYEDSYTFRLLALYLSKEERDIHYTIGGDQDIFFTTLHITH